MKKDNRGLTLIELIVTIAIIAIFSGVVLTFVGTGANSYRNTSNNAEAQMETQQALDQIQNIIIDTNRSVYYAAGKGINENIGEVIYSDIDEGDSRSKTFFATSAVPLSDPDQPNSYKYVCEAIEWDFDEKKLYYGSRTWEGTETFHSDGGGGTALDNGQEGGSGTPDSQNGNQVLNTGNSNGISDEMTLSNGNSSVTRNRTSEIITKVPRTVLAEDITGFEVDITKAPKEQIIRFQLYTEKRGKKIRTLHTVNLRNRVQIAPPGADYGTADPTGAWIRITRYPEIMYPGDSSSEFDKLMDGNINLETVKWVVESGNGEFTSNSNKSAILKVSDQAKQGDKIVVHVEAQTTNGEQVQSQSVKIRIESPKVPESIKPDKPSILLGVGNIYDLKDIVSWKVKYTNGEDGEKINNSRIKWSIENPVSGIEFKGSVLVIKDILGTDGSNSNFTLKAEYTISDGKKLSGDVKAVLARIDILKPYGEYTVGDEKTFEFAYKEGGTSVELTEALPQLKVESAPVDLGNPYTPGDAFTEEEIGDWKVSTEFPVSKRNGYGTVRDVSKFTVKRAVLDILYSGGNDTLAAGGKYWCSHSGANKAHIWMDYVPDYGTETYEMTWSVQDTFDSKTNILFDNKDNYILEIGPTEKGFTLSATMTTTKNDTGEKSTFEAVRNVRVAQKDLIITSPDTDIVYWGENKTYDLRAEAEITWREGGQYKEAYVPVEKYTERKVINKEQNWISDSPWNVDEKDSKGECTVTVETQTVPKVLQGNTQVTFSGKKVVEVKDSVTAEIVVVDNKTTIFPGESLQFWLKLTDKNGTILDGSAEWQSQLTDAIKVKSQTSVKENLNTYTAPTSGSDSQDTITANYEVDYKGKIIQGTVSKDIYITPLTMTLNHQHDTLYFGMEPEVITARIIDASNNIEVTDRYDIQWTIAPTDASYSIEGNRNIANFKVNSAVSTDKVVTVTAIAKDKNSSSITCSATTTLRVNSKETKVKSYDCSASQTQALVFDPEDSSQKLQQMKVSYLPAIGGSPVSVDINKIPTLTLTGTTPVNLSITMNQDSGNFDQYKYILISAELETVLYNFYIYPIKNNIYNGEYGTATEAIAYAPYDLESIKKLATLLPEGYTYQYIDNTNTPCEIRLSIHTKTGVGTFEGLLWNSSMNKWFMKRGDIYYKYHNGGWYEFKNGSTYSPLKKYMYTQYYWKLDETIFLLEGDLLIENTTFWQKWN